VAEPPPRGQNEAQSLLTEALSREAEAHRLLMEGRPDEAREVLQAVAGLYRRSWEAAPPRSYGRLVGMVKAAILAGEAGPAAAEVRREIGPEGDSPASWYALALAALVEGEEDLAARAAEGMRGGSEAFDRTADAVDALAAGDAERYGAALRAIVEDFEARSEHLTGVAIADTALALERLAGERGFRADVRSAVVPSDA
jgi:hypothetical protein